jgi:hypothetical protein
MYINAHFKGYSKALLLLRADFLDVSVFHEHLYGEYCLKQTVGVDNKWRNVNLNPYTQLLRGLVKVHKKDLPIRPIVNSRSAPPTDQQKCSQKK